MLKTSQNLNAQEDKINNKSIDPLFNKLPDYVSCMWELPQIFEFLCFAKETLHIEHLSMYEMERMLTMPKASKQLANIMTCLLGPSVPRSRLMKIPAMPYEFWTSVLLKQKAAYWIKVYENKEHDSVKVLDTIGVEPEFWTLFPDTSIISHCDFEDFNLRQRVWLLKTLCDTMMHGKKSLQDEVTNRYLDGEGEKILGRDRYGSRYICFPIFHNNDLRIYKFSLNNKVLSNVAPIISKSKIHTRHLNNRRDRRRKKSRWKNGNLPQKQKKRIVKVIQVKKNELQCDIKVEVGEECSNVTSEINLNTIVETQKTNMKIEKEEEEEKATSVGETEKLLENKDEEIHVEEKDVQVMSPSLTSKLSDVEKNDGQPYPDNVCNSLKTDDEKINEIKTITSSSNNIVCPLTMNSGVISKSDDEKIIATKIVVDNDDDDDDDGDDDKKKTNNTGNLNDENCLNLQIKTSIDTDDSKDNIKECKNTNLNCTQTESKIEIKNLNNILKDLSVTSFQLIADDMISLKELISTLSMQNSIHKAEPVRCEMLLIKKLKNLMYSLRSKEHLLMDAATIARVKLEHEWMNFQKGIDDDDDVSKCARYSSKWVLGSQGCPLLSCRETVQSDEIESVHDKSESEKNDDDEDENVPEKKTETRRVLRARGVSSYMEQFSSDDDTDSSHPEGWAEIVDPTTGIHLGMPSAQPDGAEEDDVESAGSGSDQDWILPGKRKRKSKRISPGKRLKSFQHKVQTIKEELKNNESTPILDVENKQKNICSKNSLSEIRIQSVHSEFHIKDEISAIESSTTNTQTIVNDNNLQQNYVIHQVNTPNGPMNYVVLPNDNPPIAQTSAMVSVMPQVPVQPGYYMQNPQGYFISNPQLAQVQAPYVDEQNLQSMHGVIIQPNNQSYATPPNNYLQYQQIRMAPSVSMYPTSVQSSIMNPPISFPTQITKVQPRIIQDRQIVPPYRPRHPVGAVIRSTVPFKAVIRLPSSGRGRGSKVVQQNPKASPNIRSSRINTEKNTKQRDTTKTTSLIVLSDSDDEIEMIIPQKNNKIEPKRVQNKNLTTSQTKIINNNNKNNSNNNNNNNNSSSSNNNNSDNSSVTLSASNNHQSSSQCILTPQIIQRMSQGGISITPIKPKIPKKSSSISATQLVVVVNETGSHYALALPNGSKLILTPEQVAQIRASNGGKLAL